MKKSIFNIVLAASLIGGCKKTDDFLTKLPLDRLSDQSYWTSEANVRTFAWDFYPAYFPGYASGFDLSWGGYFSGESLNDDFAPTTPTPFTKNVPASGGGWSFTNIRKANLFLERVKGVPFTTDDARNNWVGIARFFRAMEYSSKVKAFGDYPWYSVAITNENDTTALYRPRDPREMVMDSVLADFQYAAANVRVEDNTTGPKGLIVNRAVVLAFMSRIFLFEGTWQKYHKANTSKANEYLEQAKWAANEVLNMNAYSLAPDYRKMFNSLDLSTNTEMILYRRYESGAGMLMHSLHSYVNKEAQTGASRNLIESYLSEDGLPISLSPLYKGDKTIANVMTDRDPRLYATIVPALRLNGVVTNYSTSGYATLKFFNDAIKDIADGNSNTNTTDAPVIRLGEVMMNYVEAAAELGILTQDDLDRTINKLRSRAGIGMPRLVLDGGAPSVNGVVYDDPNRDPTVPSILWEIRRERRIELAMEGFRTDDLRRWKKLEYTDTKQNITINRGAWIRKSDYPTTLSATIEDDPATPEVEGYIIPSTKSELERPFPGIKVYLNPLPEDQIKLYRDRGVDLKQNPEWN